MDVTRPIKMGWGTSTRRRGSTLADRGWVYGTATVQSLEVNIVFMKAARVRSTAGRARRSGDTSGDIKVAL